MDYYLADVETTRNVQELGKNINGFIR